MSKQDLTLAAGQTVEFYEPGDFFRLLKADQPVRIEFYRNGAEISEAPGVTTGYAEKMRLGEFDRIRVYSATAQTVSLVTRMGADVYFDAPPTGNVTVSNAVTIANPVTSVSVSNPVEIANPLLLVSLDNPSINVNVLNPVSTVTVANPVSTVTVANPVTTVTVANPVTSVSVSNVNGAFGNLAHTVTNVSATLRAAKSTRRYLLIQNKDATGVVYVTLDGTAATAANGVKIEPGGSYELSEFCPTGAIVAIGDIASNANVITVEG